MFMCVCGSALSSLEIAYDLAVVLVDLLDVEDLHAVLVFPGLEDGLQLA